MRNFEIVDKRPIGVAFPDEESESGFGFFAGTGKHRKNESCEEKQRAFHRASRKLANILYHEWGIRNEQRTGLRTGSKNSKTKRLAEY